MKLLDNAVLDNMLTTRFRNWRGVVLITLYGLLLLGVIALVAGFGFVTSGAIDSNMIGTALYYILAVFQFALIVFIMPAITAGMISGERERKTLDLLLCTQMTPLAVVAGKLFSGCLYMVLCVVCSIPMLTMVYLYGGVSILNVLSVVAVYLVTIIAIGSLGIFFSTILKRTTAAVVVTYLAVFLLGIVSTVGGYAQLALDVYLHSSLPNYVPGYPALWIINPAMAMLEALGPAGAMGGIGVLAITGQNLWPPMWGWELMALLLVSALLIFLSSRILAPRRGWLTWKNSSGAARQVGQQ